MISTPHRFHIPVMGIGYTLDTPIKVAKYGISSVISIVQDDVIEKARSHYSQINNFAYKPITTHHKDYRSRRITQYLNLVNELVNQSFEDLKNTPSELAKYARLLPGNISAEMLQDNPSILQKGSIDVNIMTKVDRQPSKDESVLTDACSALKGYAFSNLDSSLVLSAGLNPRLFNYMLQFKDFYPDANGYIKKRIVVKVSDYRSALVQGKMLAKKGLWVSEYRIESGLNCGGHTFATEGILLGPILEEFKQNREAMLTEQLQLCEQEWKANGISQLKEVIQNITVQGGLGNSSERTMMEKYFNIDATGWGSPFLLVPEATSVDNTTLAELMKAEEQDIYNSGISPLGVRFNTLKNNSGAQEKSRRIALGKPGSPCVHKHLAFDTTYNEEGLCSASIAFQKKKITELKQQGLSPTAYETAYQGIVEKECICDGLAVSFLKKFNLMSKENGQGVSICPGPNLAYFDKTYSLEEMVNHIYGKQQVLTKERPHVFVKELELYMAFYRELENTYNQSEATTLKEEKRLAKFSNNLIEGIEYYEQLLEQITFENSLELIKFGEALVLAKEELVAEREEAVF